MAYTTVEKVRIAAKNLEIHGGKLSTMLESEFNQILDEADQIINSVLSSVYYVPLRQITRNSTTKYPDPIPYIATRIAAALGVRSAYARIDPQVSENADAHFKDALRELNDIVAYGRRLEGQDLKYPNSFVNPYSAPLMPKNNNNTGVQ